ncbi:MAG: PEP/pyruvate-binding domain-containing protein, partial [Erythrobacter sp.]
MTLKTVYVFGGNADHSDPRQKDKTVAGGKGANLAEMASIGLPVPPGFTITTEECVAYLQGGADFSDDLRAAVAAALTHVEATVGTRFGDAADPLLVSVRSGARVSMPGM